MKNIFLIKTDDEEKEFRRKFPKEFALIDMIKLDEARKELKQETNDSSLKLLQVMELVELALQNGSIHPGSFIIRNAVRECIGLEPIK
jgi:hypothetical protein